MGTATLLAAGNGGQGAGAEIDLPYDMVLRHVVDGGTIGEVLMYHRVYEEDLDVALEGLVDEFVFVGGWGCFFSMWVSLPGRPWIGGLCMGKVVKWCYVWGGYSVLLLLLLELQMFSIDFVLI